MSAVAKKDQAVEAALANTEHIKPASTTETNDELKEYSRALLEQAIEVGKGNEHCDSYSFVQLPYAKLQNGSKHHRRSLSTCATLQHVLHTHIFHLFPQITFH